MTWRYAALALTAALAPAAPAQYFGRNKVQYKKLDFQVLKTDLPPDKIPVDSGSAKAKEDGKVGEIASIPGIRVIFFLSVVTVAAQDLLWPA